jgi:hypothetical protein
MKILGLYIIKIYLISIKIFGLVILKIRFYNIRWKYKIIDNVLSKKNQGSDFSNP